VAKNADTMMRTPKIDSMYKPNPRPSTIRSAPKVRSVLFMAACRSVLETCVVLRIEDGGPGRNWTADLGALRFAVFC